MKYPAVKLNQVHLNLGQDQTHVHILKGISLEIAQNEAVGIVGPSGSGKSSLLMCMAGLEKITAGEISILGERMDNLDEDALARFRAQHFGFVFQSFHLIPTMTAVENVALPLELAGIPKARQRAANLLGEVGLQNRQNHYPGQMSGGEQQRVALARALVGEPKILFADEPTGNLDGKTGTHIIELIFALRREHDATLILVTHDNSLAALCDRTIRLESGLIADLSPAGSAA